MGALVVVREVVRAVVGARVVVVVLNPLVISYNPPRTDATIRSA